MIEPTRHLAEIMTKARGPAYYYRFSYVGEPYRKKLPGALHGLEIPYAYDLPVAFDGKTCVMRDKPEADQLMTRTMAGYWANFVRTGDPNGADLPKWPRYDPLAKDILDFANTGVTVGPDPLRSRLDLWESVFEQTR